MYELTLKIFVANAQYILLYYTRFVFKSQSLCKYKNNDNFDSNGFKVVIIFQQDRQYACLAL